MKNRVDHVEIKTLDLWSDNTLVLLWPANCCQPHLPLSLTLGVVMFASESSTLGKCLLNIHQKAKELVYDPLRFSADMIPNMRNEESEYLPVGIFWDLNNQIWLDMQDQQLQWEPVISSVPPSLWAERRAWCFMRAICNTNMTWTDCGGWGLSEPIVWRPV